MRTLGRRHHLNLRVALLLLWIALLGIAVGAIFAEGQRLGGATTPAYSAQPSATAAPPTGRRWFFDRSLWQQTAPQP